MGLGDPERQAVRAVILVPTRELSEQVAKHLRGLLKYCEKEVTLANVASGASTHLEKCVILSTCNSAPVLITFERTLVADSPDIIIATPSRVLSFVQAKVCANAIREFYGSLITPIDHRHSVFCLWSRL